VIALGWVFIFLATRGEAVNLSKMQRPRGSIRSAQIVLCDVKKLAAQDAVISWAGFKAAVLVDSPGFLLSFRAVPEDLGPKVGFEMVLLI
jgi:hypothetical protein